MSEIASEIRGHAEEILGLVGSIPTRFEPRPLRLEHYRGKPSTDGLYRWRVVHRNGNVMAQGEAYKKRASRDKATRTLFPDLEPVEVES